MPWFKGLWFDHVLSEEDHVKAFNAAMDGSVLEAPPAPAEPEAPAPEAPPAEPEAPPAPAEPPAEPESPPAEPEAPPVVDPDAPPAVDDPVAALEAANDKAALVAMAKNLGIDTKGMNKSQIAQAIVAASTASQA